MAHYRYRPYRANRSGGRRRHNIRYFALALMVIIAVIFILNKSRDKNEFAQIQPEKNLTLIDILPATAEAVQSGQLEDYAEPEPEAELLPEPELITGVIESGDDGGSRVIDLITEAHNDIVAGETIAARDKLNLVSTMDLNPQDLAVIKAQLGKLSEKWLFSRDHYAGDSLTAMYEVQSGDLLSEIGKQYKVPYEILMTINNIKRPEHLRAGENIKVINGPFHAIIYRSSFTMDLYLGNKTYVKTYRIGLGEVGKETPTGRWRVKKDGKHIKPTWTDDETGRTYVADDPDYPLGSRWISLKGLDGNAKDRTGFGIHGTKDPRTIGTRSSRGCIRLLNGDVIEVYNLLVPGLSEVRVVD